MHEMLTVLTDVCSVSLSVTLLKLAAARAVYNMCRVHRVILCSRRQMSLASCYFIVIVFARRRRVIVVYFIQFNVFSVDICFVIR